MQLLCMTPMHLQVRASGIGLSTIFQRMLLNWLLVQEMHQESSCLQDLFKVVQISAPMHLVEHALQKETSPIVIFSRSIH